jgi:hypothetical protein
MRFILAVFIAGLLAGCVDVKPLAPIDDEPDWSSTPFGETWWPHQDGSLSNLTGAGSFPLEWSWAEWLAGTMPPLWQGGERDEAFVITSANVTLTYGPGLPALPSTQNRPQFTMWFGAGDSIIEHGFQAGPDVWTDFETVTFPVDSLPRGGLVVPAGVLLKLHVGLYYPGVDQVGSGNLLLADSMLEFQGHTVQLPGPTDQTVVWNTNRDLLGGRCITDLNQLGTAMGSGTFEVTNTTIAIDAVVTREGAGGSDIDFFISDAGGTVVAYASGPSSPEALHLRAPNLAEAVPGTWTATAYNCQPQRSAVHIAVTVSEPALLAVAEPA